MSSLRNAAAMGRNITKEPTLSKCKIRFKVKHLAGYDYLLQDNRKARKVRPDYQTTNETLKLKTKNYNIIINICKTTIYIN